MNKVYALILASGAGERIGSCLPKQFIKISGKTVLEHTIDAFESNEHIDEIITVIHPHYRNLVEEINLKNKYKKVRHILSGGRTRRESSYIGVNAIEDQHSYVLIHDGVRPFVSRQIINTCIEKLQFYNAVVVAVPSVDTLIEVTDSMFIDSIPDRKYIMRVQTPQAFKSAIIKKAHNHSLNDKNIEFTDDCSLVLKYKCADIYVVPGELSNIKITYPEDLLLIDKFLEHRDI